MYLFGADALIHRVAVHINTHWHCDCISILQVFIYMFVSVAFLQGRLRYCTCIYVVEGQGDQICHLNL